MQHLYSYRFRLSPNKNQEILLNKHFGCIRFLYNHFLEQRKQLYQEKKQTLNYYDDQNEIPNLKQTYTWLKEVGSQALQYSARMLQNAYDNFFRNCKKKIKGKKGFPRFKNKHEKQSFKVMQNIKVDGHKLIIPKFLEGINIVLHRPIEGQIKFATVSKNKAGQYFVSITVKRDIQELPKTNTSIGLDVNVQNIVDNQGNKYTSPTINHKFIRFLSKEVSRKKLNSKGRSDAQLRLNKYKQKIINIREDFQHKVTSKIINENQVIVIEDLDVKSMLENKDEVKRWKEKRKHRNISNSGFASFLHKIMYKAVWYGRQLIKVSRWFPSSQLCSACGWRNKELGEEREWLCSNCWTIHDRDENAAVNIHREGTTGTVGIANCLSVRPTLVGN